MSYDRATFRILGEEPSKHLEESPNEYLENDRTANYPLSEDPNFSYDPQQAYLMELFAARDALAHHNIERAKTHLLCAVELNSGVQIEKGSYGKKIKP